MRGIIHHLDLTVTDPHVSFGLYDAVLRELGYELHKQDERGFAWKLATAAGTHEVNIIRAKSGAQPHDRYSPGLHHVAWTVESRTAVDRMHQLLLELKANVLDAPAEYPEYNNGKGYYAVFFADPDGLKLECVFTPAPSGA
jgi:catechol 2,3-dioxygenase-like lactoylglutathione lyase family enzyme